MTIILFLVDTSASMNQRTFHGSTILDVTKNAIETFQKIRQKNPNSKWDRLMLLTYDEPPGNIKAGWKETHLQFATQLKNLTAHGVTEVGSALKNAFNMLNMNRNQSGIDTYGQGRCPFYIEPAVIISFSDGESMVTSSGIHKQLTLPMANGLVGSELTKEPFRWDQRVFGIVLKLPAVEMPEPNSDTTFIPSAESSPIDSMCEVTGGRSYLVSTPKQLNQTLESLAQKAAMHGVVVNFDYTEPQIPLNDETGDINRPLSPSQTNSWKSTKRMIFVKSSAQRGHSVGHWPLPESYWPDCKAKTLMARDAQPIIKFCSPLPPPAAHLMNLLPIDVYELEASPLTQHILKAKSNYCYQAFINQSSKYNDFPFGFLQSHSTSQKVFLHVMPYNYPVLFSLLDELKNMSMKPTAKWKTEFENYLRAMPGYYAPYLRRALGRMGVHGMVPESLDSCLSFMVVSHLKQVRTKAKQEYEALVASVGQCVPPTDAIQVVNKGAHSLLARRDFNELLQYSEGDYSSIASLQRELLKYDSFHISVPRSNATARKTLNYKNPYDIDRKDLLSQISKLRAFLLRPKGTGGSLLKDEHLHSVPIQRMGMYHEYLAKAHPPLRQLDTQPERMHTFGNPFKVNKNLMIDEADEAMPGMAMSAGGSGGSKRNKREATDCPPSSPARKKRKPGPLPRHISLSNRPTTPPIPPLSPVPPCSPGASNAEGEGDGGGLVKAKLNNSRPILKVGLQDTELNGIVVKQNGILGSSNQSPPSASLHTTTTSAPTQFTAKIVQQSGLSLPKPRTLTPTSTAQLHNNHLLRTILNQVKRPGKNYTELFRQLSILQGDVAEKRMVLDRVIYEAYRFKRMAMVDRLTSYKESLSSSSHTNGVLPEQTDNGDASTSQPGSHTSKNIKIGKTVTASTKTSEVNNLKTTIGTSNQHQAV